MRRRLLSFPLILAFAIPWVPRELAAQGLDATALCRREFAADFPTVSEAADGCDLAWDVDVAPSLDGVPAEHPGDYRFVWEAGEPGLPFYSVYRSKRFDGSADEPLRCRLEGKGGNPEIFGDVLVRQQPEIEMSTLDETNDMTWYRVSAIDPCQHCDPRPSEAPSCPPPPRAIPMCGVFAEVCGADPDHPLCDGWRTQRRRKVGVTDGRFLVWREKPCRPEGPIECPSSQQVLDQDLYGFQLPAADPSEPFSCGPGNLFVVADQDDQDLVAFEHSPRVATIDSDRSLVVYRRCVGPRGQTKDETCSADQQIWGVYLSRAAGGVLGEPFPIDDDPGSWNRNWPDVQGDLVVWDRKEPGIKREIWGCQAPRFPEGHPMAGLLDFERCRDHRFRVTGVPRGPSQAKQERPAVWGSVVAYGDRRTEACWSGCANQGNVHASWLQRGEDDRVLVDDVGGLPQARAAHARATFDEPARQRNPRLAARETGNRVLALFPDTRHTGCVREGGTDQQCSDRCIPIEPDDAPGCEGLSPFEPCCDFKTAAGTYCDDVFGSELAVVPAPAAPRCDLRADGRPYLSIDLASDWLEPVRLEITHSAVCSLVGVGGSQTACVANTVTETLTLAPGSNPIELSCSCLAGPGQTARGRYQIEAVRVLSGSECEPQPGLGFVRGEMLDCG